MKSVLFLLAIVPIFAQSQDIPTKADQLLKAYSDQKKFSGTVLIAQNDKVIFEKAYGYSDVQKELPNTLQTEYRAGSLTKMFTSALVLKLVSENRLKLIDPVSTYVSNFSYGNKITIQHLLSHTSGITGFTKPPAPTNLAQSVTQFAYDSLAFEPGSQFAYNNFNYILLSYIAEKITGKPFAGLLMEKIIQPAGLTQTGIDFSNRTSRYKAKGYTTNPETATWEEMNANVEIASGAGAIYTTATDLYHWYKAFNAGKVIPIDMVKKAQTVFQGNYGMGWIVNNNQAHKSIGHTGAIEGFKAYEMIYPDDNMVIIWLSNYQDVDGAKLGDQLSAVVFNQPYTLPTRKTAIALTADQLKKLEGTYVLNEHFSITVTANNDKLYALAAGDPNSIELTPESETKFFLKGPETEVEFIQENGKVVSMFVNMQGGMRLQKKV